MENAELPRLRRERESFAAPAQQRKEPPAESNSSATWADWLEYLAFRALLAFFRLLPLPVGLRAGSALGMLAYWLFPAQRRVAMRNLAVAFPDREPSRRRAVLRESCRNLGRLAAEVSHFDRLSREEIATRVEFSDRPRWERLLAERGGSGLVVLTAHFGNWELLAHLHGLLGYPVTLIHRPMRNPLIDEWLLRWRARAGTRSIPKRAAARDALRALRNGAIVAVPGDQNQVFSFGVFVDFFGLPACTTAGPVRLAQHVGAPLVPVFLRRKGGSAQHVLEVQEPVELVDTGNREQDLVTNTQRCSKVIEEMIRRHPEQWIWFHKRWKTRPPGEPRFYD